MKTTVFALVAALTLGLGTASAEELKDGHRDVDPHDRVFLVQDEHGGGAAWSSGLGSQNRISLSKAA